jgi:hypothetical protein
VIGLTCTVVDPTLPSTLNLNIQHLFSPASVAQNSIGFQSATGGPTLTGAMNIGLTDINIGGQPLKHLAT